MAHFSTGLDSLQASLNAVLRDAEPLAPADRLRRLVRSRPRELAESLDDAVIDWSDRWLSEIDRRWERGLRASTVADLRVAVAEIGGHATTLVRYEEELRVRSTPAGTYAISVDGDPLTNPPRAPKWIELLTVGWDDRLPPFPSPLSSFRDARRGRS